MDQDENRAADRSKPGSGPRFRFRAAGGPVLYFADFEAAVAFYTEVLGEPGYPEGGGTRGWSIGDSFLTLLRGGDGSPRNTEIGLVTEMPGEADRLQEAFIAAGGAGPAPCDQVMY
jgi:catechol 2,3-dioxygenase-like lactoylglutathione lyase family enzyme